MLTAPSFEQVIPSFALELLESLSLDRDTEKTAVPPGPTTDTGTLEKV